MILLALITPLLAAVPDQAIVDAWTRYSTHAVVPQPLPDRDQRARLLKGDLVKVRLATHGAAPVGAMGMIIVDELTRPELWLGSMDAHFSGGIDNLTTHWMTPVGDELLRWYGFIDLPRPFADRHFLIQTTINPTVAAASENTMWARSWRLEPGGEDTMRALVQAGAVADISPERFERAIYVPINHGEWVFLDLPEGKTLFVYHAASAMGGEIPQRLVTSYLFFGLGQIMNEVIERAKKVRGHYQGSHPPLLGGDSQPIPLYP